MAKNQYHPATVALHSDHALISDQAVSPPICQSVTYFSDGPRDFADKAVTPHHSGFYGRHGNPTSARLAKVIAELEGADAGMILSSGMGAITTTILSFIGCGDHVISQSGQYSATASFLRGFLARFGVEVSFVDQTAPAAFAKALRQNTKLIFIETPVNPLLSLTDLTAVSNIAKAAGVLTICDNTLASPINQRPLDFGIDLVVHSATKYIGGHHDLLAGAVVGSQALLDRIWDTSMDLGPISAPFDAWLALRGIRTLKPRIDLHNTNAMEIATYLQQHAGVLRVHYPGLQSHPQHDLALQQMQGFGGVLSFDLQGGYEAAHKFVSGLTLCLNAPSLGGIDTLVVQPAAMFRARMTDNEIRTRGITPGLVRMSIGIENVDDLLRDIKHSLSASSA